MDVVLVDYSLGQRLGEDAEMCGKTLGFLVHGIIAVKCRVKAHVGYEPAAVAESEVKIACGIRQRLIFARHQQAAMDRNVCDGIE